MLERNGLTADDIISILFTATPDLTAEFPAYAARLLGLTDVPLHVRVGDRGPGRACRGCCGCSRTWRPTASPRRAAPRLPAGRRGAAHRSAPVAPTASDRRCRARRDHRRPARAMLGRDRAHGVRRGRQGRWPGEGRTVTGRLRGVVAMDGPSGTGKSTVSRRLAVAGSAPRTSTPARCTARSPWPCCARASSGTSPRRRAGRRRRRPDRARRSTDPEAPRHPARRRGRRGRDPRPRGDRRGERGLGGAAGARRAGGAAARHRRRRARTARRHRRGGPRHRQRRGPGRPAEGLPHRLRGDPRRAARGARTARPAAAPTRPPCSPTSAAATELDSTRKTSPLHAAADALVLDTDDLPRRRRADASCCGWCEERGLLT